MKRKLKWDYNRDGLLDWTAHKGRVIFAVYFNKYLCGWEAFVQDPQEGCWWNKLHAGSVKSFREAMDICEKHWLWMQKESRK